MKLWIFKEPKICTWTRWKSKIKHKRKNRFYPQILLLTSHLAEILLYHFFQSPCCCLNCKGCNRNVFLYFFPGWTWVCFIFNIKHSIIDPWKWFSSIFVVPTWSKDDVPIRKKKKENIKEGRLSLRIYICFVCIFSTHFLLLDHMLY